MAQDVNTVAPPVPVIAPGATIGILGGGQLGRMTAMAAARLGYFVHILAPEAGGPAAQVAARETVAAFDDEAALARFADSVDVATFEFENVPAEAAAFLETRVPLRPGRACLAIAQDRVREKTFLSRIAVPTAPFRKVTSPAELDRALAEIGRPAVLKTARLGYDGKGQVMVASDTDAAEAFARMGARRGIVEGFVDFESEISVILARQGHGLVGTFDVVENRHRHRILDTTVAPAPIPQAVAEAATAMAGAIADKLDLVGLLAVEMFVTHDHRVLVNEIAPRPHNSGHWTIDACVTSQFEQFVRAVCGLPLGNPARHSNAVMRNLIGDDVERAVELIRDPNVKLHLYGKDEARAGRKMGHVTRLYPLETPMVDMAGSDGAPNLGSLIAAMAERGRR